MTANHHLLNDHLPGDPFLWEGGPVGVLLSHGYTATTAEVRPVAQRLHSRGFTVAGTLLPGHGESPATMNRCHWPDWVAALEADYLRLAHRCEHVFIGGESMGGLLTLYLASLHPEISGVLSYSPAVKIPLMARVQAQFVRPFKSEVVKRSLNDIHPEWHGYRMNPVPAFYEMLAAQRALWPRLPHMRQPLLVVQGRHDKDIDLNGVTQLFRQHGAALKEFHWMEQSAHVVLLEQEREQVAEITARFMYRVLGSQVR
jgi:carboxylesterase